MNGVEIVVPEALVIVATVIVGFVINQAAAWLGIKMSLEAKKAVVFVVATAASAVAVFQAGIDLPDPAADPMGFAVALMALATLNFKIAQPVYDRIWRGLLSAKA